MVVEKLIELEKLLVGVEKLLVGVEKLLVGVEKLVVVKKRPPAESQKQVLRHKKMKREAKKYGKKYGNQLNAYFVRQTDAAAKAAEIRAQAKEP